MGALVVFELGSLVCAVAPDSTALIVGRAIAGLGSAAIFSGAIITIGKELFTLLTMFDMLTRYRHDRGAREASYFFWNDWWRLWHRFSRRPAGAFDWSTNHFYQFKKRLSTNLRPELAWRCLHQQPASNLEMVFLHQSSLRRRHRCGIAHIPPLKGDTTDHRPLVYCSEEPRSYRHPDLRPRYSLRPTRPAVRRCHLPLVQRSGYSLTCRFRCRYHRLHRTTILPGK